jgi:hypothetical protein
MIHKKALLFSFLLLNTVRIFAQGNIVNLQLAAEGFTQPVTMMEAPDGTGRLFVADQIGEIKIVTADSMFAQPFLDIRSRIVTLNPSYDERGLLGLAFHPDYAQERQVLCFL